MSTDNATSFLDEFLEAVSASPIDEPNVDLDNTSHAPARHARTHSREEALPPDNDYRREMARRAHIRWNREGRPIDRYNRTVDDVRRAVQAAASFASMLRQIAADADAQLTFGREGSARTFRRRLELDAAVADRVAERDRVWSERLAEAEQIEAEKKRELEASR